MEPEGLHPSTAFTLRPSVLVRRTEAGPVRRLDLESRSCSGPASLSCFGPEGLVALGPVLFCPGVPIPIEVPEPIATTRLRIVVSPQDGPPVSLEIALPPARPWVVHLVQLSHHDLGYTSLPSLVRQEHARWLEQAVEFAHDSSEYPEDARFRAVIEQAWSLETFFDRARPGVAREMVRLLREGRMEMGALSGNLVTEAMGHAEMLRCLQPAATLARRYGFSLTSAEHNDIPGVSQGLAAALAAARIPLLVLGLPTYHLWGGEGIDPLWDEARLFGRGCPTVGRYASPDGQEILLWCGNRGCGGDMRSRIDGLADILREYEENGYAHDILRWAVQGAARDNAPYRFGYCDFAREWNEKWISPRLVVSTNARFLRDFRSRLTRELPVVRGDLPGQDYPSGLLSMAGPTLLNRKTQQVLPEVSGLVALARVYGRSPSPPDRMDQAWADCLAYDEHAFGLHFPAGPAAAAVEAEKALAAFRSAALAHDDACRSMAALLEDLPPVPDGCWLAVYNPSPHRVDRGVHTPLRELDNFLGDLHAVPPDQDPAGQGYLAGVPLGTRWHDFPPDAFLQGAFRLVDARNNEIPFVLTTVEDWRGDAHAARRAGLGRSGGRIDFQATAAGLLLDLHFVARDLPACGIALYRLLPTASIRPPVRFEPCDEGDIANGYYRISLRDGRVRIFSRTLDRDLFVEGGPDRPFQFLVTSPEGPMTRGAVTGLLKLESPVLSALRIVGSAPGHPRTAVTLALLEGLDRVDIRVEVLKDDTPLLDVQMALPFAMTAPRLLCDGVLSASEPGRDWMAPCRAGAVPVNEWVVLNGFDSALLMGSLSPMMGYDEPTTANVSFAHRSVYRKDRTWPFRGPARSGRIYWHLFDNNFGTNFAVTQCGCHAFSGTLRACGAPLSEAEADRAARAMQDNAIPQFRQGREGGWPTFPFGQDLLRLPDTIRLLSLEALPGRRAFRLQLWNRTDQPQATRLAFGGMRVFRVRRTTATGGAPGPLPTNGRSVRLDLAPHALLTVETALERIGPEGPVLRKGVEP